jgi:hypothetical protein
MCASNICASAVHNAGEPRWQYANVRTTAEAGERICFIHYLRRTDRPLAPCLYRPLAPCLYHQPLNPSKTCQSQPVNPRSQICATSLECSLRSVLHVDDLLHAHGLENSDHGGSTGSEPFLQFFGSRFILGHPDILAHVTT